MKVTTAILVGVSVSDMAMMARESVRRPSPAGRVRKVIAGDQLGRTLPNLPHW